MKGEKSILGRFLWVALPLAFCLLGINVSSHAGLHDWGVKGVGDPGKVEKVLQITDPPFFHDTRYSGYADPWNFDGSWIVYTVRTDVESTSTDDYLLYKIRPDGTGRTKLSGNDVDDTNASFASDGRIYFDRKTHDDWKYQVYRMEQDGSAVKNLTAVHGGDCEQFSRPSPDGTLVAFLDCWNNELRIVRSDGTFPKTVSGTQTIAYPQHAWSPDSQWLAFKGDNGVYQWIYKVKRDGTSPIVWTEPSLFVFGSNAHQWPVWSPDGRHIAYIWKTWGTDYSHYSLMVISAEDSSAEQLVLDSASSSASPGWQEINGPVSWSPDGKWLSYYKTFEGGTYHVIFMVPLDGSSTPIQLTINYSDFLPRWSPDGSRILFRDSGTSSSRDEDFYDDLLLLKMRGGYGKFPWPIFLPAITSGQ